MLSLPAIKVSIAKGYLTANAEHGFVNAYLMAVDARPSQHLRFTVYLESGAIWSGLPIEAIYCDRFGLITPDNLTTETLQPFSCLEGPVSIISYPLIKHAHLETRLGKARYLFTINYEGEGLSEDPEQAKSHNIVVLQNGRLAALPNNYMRVVDNWFSEADQSTSNYKRTNRFFFPGG